MGDDVPQENRRDAPSRLAARLRARVLRRSSSLTAGRIAVGVATLLVVPVVGGAEVVAHQSSRYSIAESAPPTAAPAYTLLDPNWLLPPVEALEAELPLAGAERTDQILRDDVAVEPAPQRPKPSAGPMAYSLSDDLTAQLRYHHDEHFELGSAEMLRDDQSTAFSTRPDRDVIDLKMSWRLAGSTVGLGYELQSARTGAAPGEFLVSRFLPGNPQATHSITLGLTREWGAGHAAPPAAVPPLLPPPELAEAAALGTPTPSP
jgi:hypothetical protein